MIARAGVVGVAGSLLRWSRYLDQKLIILSANTFFLRSYFLQLSVGTIFGNLDPICYLQA